MPYSSLRDFMTRLEQEGELKRVKSQVDWDEEVGAIVRKVFDARGPALLFEKVKDSPFPLLAGAMDTFKRYGLGLESPEEPRAIITKALKFLTNPIEPVTVPSGPCKENIERGDSIDLSKFPVPKWHHQDGGRFIGTLGVVIARDPETGSRNMGIYRQQLLSRNKVGLLATQQVGIILQKYRALKRDMPIATALGVEPAVLAASCFLANYGQDELSMAGALRGKPVELTKCETIDLEVPATAEIVLEGVIPWDENKWEMEGPFGEFTGYYGGIRAVRPTVHLTAVTYRNNPIFQGTLEGAPPNESATLRSIGKTVGLWNAISATGIPGFKELYVTEDGCAGFIIIASLARQFYHGHARQLMEAIWAFARPKWTIIVDGDIDIFDRRQVDWALSTRVQPHRDILVTPNTEATVDLDPSVHPDERPYPFTKGSRIGINATTGFKGFEFPPLAKPREEIMAQVEKRWRDYGI